MGGGGGGGGGGGRGGKQSNNRSQIVSFEIHMTDSKQNTSYRTSK